MNRSPMRRLEALFHRAVDLPAPQRDALLAPIRRDQPELAAEVERLLERADRGDDLSSVPPLVAATAAAGSRVGPYRLVELIGEGGMGGVYRAERADGQYAQTVAVKVLRGGFVSLELRERFRFERQILARLEHPNIARLLDGSVTADGAPYLVMEYVAGRPIDEYCDAERSTVEGRLALFRTVCRAVAHAHRNLVVHRDLKPSNILVTRGGEVKLLDFGIAKLLTPDGEAGPPLTRHLFPLLTPGYASPEQIRGDSVTTATDVYALGLLLYELLCGRRAQRPEDASLAALERAVREEGRASPSDALGCGAPEDVASVVAARGGGSLGRLRKRIRGDLDTIVATALREDPARRYPSAQQLADDIDRHLTGRPVAARPDSLGYRAGKFLGRHRLAVAAAAGIALSVVVGLVLALTGLARARVAEGRALEEAATAQQISEFLVSVFDAADPELRQAGARETTAYELLEAGLARIDSARIDDPAVAARLELTLGRIAAKVGEYESAKTLLARAADAAPDPAFERRALLELGATQGRSGDENEALATLAAAIGRCEAAGDEPCVVEALAARGEIEVDRRQLAAARASLSSALARAQALPASRRSRGLIASITYGLGVAEHKAGNLQRSEELFGRSGELFGELEDQPTTQAGEGYLLLGISHAARGDHARAEELLARARRIFADLYGPRHLRVAYLDFIASATLAELGRLDRARAAAENALRVRREVLGETHKDTGMAWGRVADVLARSGDDAAALEAARTSRAITETTQRLSYANVGRQVVELSIRTGDLETALSTARETLQIYETMLGADHAMTLRGHASVAAALAAAGDLEAALASQRRAVAIGDARLRPDHPQRVDLLVDLGELERRAGRHSESRATLERALALAAAASPPQPEQAARVRALLG